MFCSSVDISDAGVNIFSVLKCALGVRIHLHLMAPVHIVMRAEFALHFSYSYRDRQVECFLQSIYLK